MLVNDLTCLATSSDRKEKQSRLFVVSLGEFFFGGGDITFSSSFDV